METVWSTQQSFNKLVDSSVEDKLSQLDDLGYDGGMIDDLDQSEYDQILADANNLRQDDLEDFEYNIAPDIAKQVRDGLVLDDKFNLVNPQDLIVNVGNAEIVTDLDAGGTLYFREEGRKEFPILGFDEDDETFIHQLDRLGILESLHRLYPEKDYLEFDDTYYFGDMIPMNWALLEEVLTRPTTKELRGIGESVNEAVSTKNPKGLAKELEEIKELADEYGKEYFTQEYYFADDPEMSMQYAYPEFYNVAYNFFKEMDFNKDKDSDDPVKNDEFKYLKANDPAKLDKMLEDLWYSVDQAAWDTIIDMCERLIRSKGKTVQAKDIYKTKYKSVLNDDEILAARERQEAEFEESLNEATNEFDKLVSGKIYKDNNSGEYKFIGIIEGEDGETLYKFEPIDELAIKTSKEVAVDEPEAFDGQYCYMPGETVNYTFFDEENFNESLNEGHLEEVILQLDDDGIYAYEVGSSKLEDKYGYYQGDVILEDDESQAKLKEFGIEPGDKFRAAVNDDEENTITILGKVIEEKVDPELKAGKPIKVDKWEYQADPKIIKKAINLLYDKLSEEEFDEFSDKAMDAYIDKDPDAIAYVKKLFKKLGLPMWVLKAYVEAWDDDYDESLDEALSPKEFDKLLHSDNYFSDDSDKLGNAFVKECDRLGIDQENASNYSELYKKLDKQGKEEITKVIKSFKESLDEDLTAHKVCIIDQGREDTDYTKYFTDETKANEYAAQLEKEVNGPSMRWHAANVSIKPIKINEALRDLPAQERFEIGTELQDIGSDLRTESGYEMKHGQPADNVDGLVDELEADLDRIHGKIKNESLTEENDNKYYVFGMGWEGEEDEWLINNLDKAKFVVDTYEDAKQKVDYLYDEELADDEIAYIVHNGKVIYDDLGPRKSLTEEIWHNRGAGDCKIIERSSSGRNALLKRLADGAIQPYVIALNMGKDSWGQGKYFSELEDAKREWKRYKFD